MTEEQKILHAPDQMVDVHERLKSLEARVAELQDNFTRVHVTEEDWTAYRKVSSLLAGVAGFPSSALQGFETHLMPTVHIEAEVSQEALLKALEQFIPQELEQSVSRLLSRRTRHKEPRLSAAESELLLRINRGLPEDVRRRYAELIFKRQSENLDQTEQAELRKLTDDVEELEADRVSALVGLARSRGISLEALMNDLGIPAPAHE